MSYKEGLVPRRSERIFAIERWFLNKLSVDYELVNNEHIEEVRNLLQQGKRVNALLDHRSLADLASGAAIAFKEKFGDLISDAVFMVALKYLDRHHTNLLLMGVNTIPMVSPGMDNDPRQTRVNRAGLKAVKNLKDGTLFIVPPEGTRSKSGKMEKGRREITTFFQKDHYILPIAFEGTEEQWPQGIQGGIKYWVGNGRNKKAKVIFGKPFAVEKMDQLVNHLAPDHRKLDRKQLSVDMTMRAIAILHLTQGNKKYVEGSYYEKFMRDLADKSWLFLKPEELIKSSSSQKQGV